MAYRLKYELVGQSSVFAKVWKVRAWKNGYLGDPISRNVPSDPFILRKDSAGTVRGTTLEFSIRAISDFEFVEFYTVNLHDWYIELIAPLDVIAWKGFLLPEQYQEPYSPAPVTVSFTAADQLGVLKNFTYAQANITRISYLDILRDCLASTGLFLGYSIAISIKEARQNINRSVLSEIYVDPTIYSGKTCYDVICDILEHFDSEITQHNCRWLIRRSVDKQLIRINYDASGLFEYATVAPAPKTLGQYNKAGTDIWATSGNLALSLETSERKIIVNEDYLTKDNILQSLDTENWIDLHTLPGWSVANVVITKINAEMPFMAVKPISVYDYNSFVKTDIHGVELSPDDIEFSFDFAFISTPRVVASRSTLIKASAKISVSVEIYDSATSVTWFLSTTGWTTAVSRLEVEDVLSSGGNSRGVDQNPDWHNFKIATNGVPAAGVMTIKLYVPLNMQYQNFVTGSAFKNVIFKFLKDNAALPTGQTRAVALNKSTKANSKTVDLIGGDVPNIPNNKLSFKAYSSISSGEETGTWTMPGVTGSDRLLVLITKLYASENRKPKQILTGMIRGVNMDFDTLILHNYPTARKFEIVEASYNLCADRADVMLREVFDYVDTAFTEVISDKAGTGSSTNSNTVVNNYTTAGDTSTPPDTVIPDTRTVLISGAIVYRAGLTFDVTKLIYKIIGRDYQNAPQSITLDTAHPALPRIDVFYVDGSSDLHILKGTPGAVPVKQLVAPGQLEITWVYLPAAAAAPTIVSDLVYDENTEWTTVEAHDADIAVDFANTNDPVSGTKNIKVAIAIPVTTQSNATHYIGEHYQGGIIFYLERGGRKGLIASEAISATGVYYESLSGGGSYVTGANNAAMYGGRPNSNILLANSKAQFHAVANTNEFSKDGLSDWFLGSKAEMEQLAFRKSFFSNLAGTFWTSTEVTGSLDWKRAYCVSLDNQTTYQRDKNNSFNVVPIRQFDDATLPVGSDPLFYTPLSTALTFTAPAPVAISNGVISFYLKSSAEWLGNTSLIFELYLSAAPVGFLYISKSTGLFGFNPADPEWQLIAFPAAKFSPTSQTIDKLKISLVNTWPSNIELGIDKIRIQHDASQVMPAPAFGKFGSTTKHVVITTDQMGNITKIEEVEQAAIGVTVDPAVIAFTNTNTPSVENYETLYANAYGQFARFLLFINDGIDDQEYWGVCRRIRIAGRIARVTWDLPDLSSGKIIIIK